MIVKLDKTKLLSLLTKNSIELLMFYRCWVDPMMDSPPCDPADPPGEGDTGLLDLPALTTALGRQALGAPAERGRSVVGEAPRRSSETSAAIPKIAAGAT